MRLPEIMFEELDFNFACIPWVKYRATSTCTVAAPVMSMLDPL